MPLFGRAGNDVALSWTDELRRVQNALGTEPLDDARHLLPPLVLPSAAQEAAGGPRAGIEYRVDMAGRSALTAGAVSGLLTPERREALDFPTAWAKAVGSDGWAPVEALSPSRQVELVAFTWSLLAVRRDGVEAAAQIGSYSASVAELAQRLGATAAPHELPEEAVRRMERLLDLRERFGISVEMRLIPAARPFFSGDIWRAAYALGMDWGDMNLFHWHDAATGTPLFTLHSLGPVAYFIPERVREGESMPGLALTFALPYSRAPVQIYDRMAMALAYFRQQLGGHTVRANGDELDGDRLADDRETLAEMVSEMSRAGIAPGSPEALELF